MKRLVVLINEEGKIESRWSTERNPLKSAKKTEQIIFVRQVENEEAKKRIHKHFEELHQKGVLNNERLKAKVDFPIQKKKLKEYHKTA